MPQETHHATETARLLGDSAASMRALFLYTHNFSRSQITEGLLRAHRRRPRR